jgi:hypothetical protein
LGAVPFRGAKVRAVDKPDWSCWLTLAKVEIRKACALSCDGDPAALAHEGVRFLNFHHAIQRYQKRCELAKEAVIAGTLQAKHDELYDGDIGYVSLAEFRAWGESLPVPLTFPERFPKPKSEQEHIAPAKQTDLRSDTKNNLRTIRALLELWNPAAEREVVSKVHQMIQSLGFDSPGDDMVRDYLDAARALKPDRPAR